MSIDVSVNVSDTAVRVHSILIIASTRSLTCRDNSDARLLQEAVKRNEKLFKGRVFLSFSKFFLSIFRIFSVTLCGLRVLFLLLANIDKLTSEIATTVVYVTSI